MILAKIIYKRICFLRQKNHPKISNGLTEINYLNFAFSMLTQ